MDELKREVRQFKAANQRAEPDLICSVFNVFLLLVNAELQISVSFQRKQTLHFSLFLLASFCAFPRDLLQFRVSLF